MRMRANGRLKRPFSAPGSGWRAPTGCPEGGLASDRTVLALWPAFPPSATVRKGHAGRERVSAYRDSGDAPTASDGRQSTAEPVATGYRPRRPATSSAQPAPDAAPAASTSRGFACRSARCVPGRSVGRRPATTDPGPARPGQPTTTREPAADTAELA